MFNVVWPLPREEGSGLTTCHDLEMEKHTKYSSVSLHWVVVIAHACRAKMWKWEPVSLLKGLIGMFVCLIFCGPRWRLRRQQLWPPKVAVGVNYRRHKM